MGLRASKRTSAADQTSPPSNSSQSNSHSGSKRAPQPDRSATDDVGGADRKSTLVDASVYDFERLERAVRSLALEHERAKLENAALRRAASLREARIAELEKKLASADQRRLSVLERIDSLMASFDGEMVDSNVVAGAEPGGDAELG